MDITVHITDFKSLSQSELIMQNLFATVTIGSTSHPGRGVILRDAQFRSGTVENPVVLTLKNSRTETVMYVRNIPISIVLAKNGLLQQWVAVYPPGDPQNLHFDVTSAPKEGCPQVCISVSIQEDLTTTGMPRPSMGYDFAPGGRLSAVSRMDLLQRDSLQRGSALERGSMGVDSAVREKELQAQRIKEHVAEMASAQRRHQDVGRMLQDNLRILEDMKRQLRGLEMQIAEQRVATQLLERDHEQLLAEEAQLQEQIKNRDITFQELRDNRDEIDRELSRVLGEGEKQKNAMESSSRDFSRQTQSMMEDIDQSQRLVSQLAASLKSKEEVVADRERQARELESARVATEAVDRDDLRAHLDQTRTAVAQARIALEEAQRRHHSADMDHQKTKTVLAGIEGEVRSLTNAVQGDDGSSGSFTSDAKADLDLKRDKLEAHNERVRLLEAELQSNRDRVEKMSTRIADLRTEAHEKELAAKRCEDEQCELQQKLATHQDGASRAKEEAGAKERQVAQAERELDESRAALQSLEGQISSRSSDPADSQANEMEQTVQMKRDQLSGTRSDLDALQKSCDELDAQVCSRRGQLQSRSAAFEQAQARVVELTNQLSAACTDIAQLDGTIRQVEESSCARSAGLDEVRCQLKERLENIAVMQAETLRAVEASRATEDELERTAAGVRAELRRLAEEKQGSESKVSELDVSMAETKLSNAKLSDSIEALRSANTAAGAQLSALHEQREAALRDLQASNDDIDHLEAATTSGMADLESTQVRIGSRLSEVASLEAAYKEAVDRMETEASSLDVQHQAMQREYSDLVDQLSAMKSEHLDISQGASSSQRRRDELDAELEKALAERVGLLRQGEDTLSKTEQQVRAAVDRAQQGAEKNSEVKSVVAGLKSKLSSTAARLETIREDVHEEESKLQGVQSQLKEKQQDLQQLQQQRAGQEAEMSSLDQMSSEMEEQVSAAQSQQLSEELAQREVQSLERQQQKLLEEQRQEDQALQEMLLTRERGAEEAYGELNSRAAETLQKKDDEIRTQMEQINNLETERQNLMQQVSGLDSESQRIQERLQERERVRQGVVSNSSRKAQECDELETTIQQSRLSTEQLERQSGEVERELAELSRREAESRGLVAAISAQIQQARAEMDRANDQADADVANETIRFNTLHTMCLSEQQEAESQRQQSLDLHGRLAEAQASCRAMGDEEEQLQALLTKAHEELAAARGSRTEENPQEQSAATAAPEDAAQVRQTVQEHEEALQQLSDRLLEAQEAVRKRRAEEEELRTDIRRLRESMRSTNDKMTHQVEHSNLQFETIQKLEEQKGKFEGEVEILTFGLHDAEQRNQYLQKENSLMQQQVEGLFEGSLQDWAAEVHRVKVDAEVAPYKEEIERWKHRAEQMRKEKQHELSTLQRQHEESLQKLRERIAAVQAEIETCEQATSRREAALSKQREHGEAAAPAAAMPGLVVPQRPLPTGHQRRKALLVGINYTTSHAPLKGCVNDLWNLQCLLRHTLQYGDDHLRLLIDCVDGRTQKPERAPTKANIQAGLQWLVSGAQPGDNLLFIFCGYGAQHPSVPGSDQYEGYLVPVDFASDLPADFFDPKVERSVPAKGSPGYRLVPMMELSYYISQLPPICRMSVMMDCCYASVPNISVSGSNTPWTFPKIARGQVDYSKLRDFISRPRFLELPVLPVQHTPPHIQPSGLVKCWLHCFFGSKLEEWSAEFPIEGTVQGAFSWAFLKALARGHFHCGLYQFQRMLTEMLADLKVHFRGVEQTPVLQLSQTASMQDVVLWT
mmetsp:Transcript_14524/g.51077  ORF Transcript_14524/g.51077 Transcript_14524/m.51077 type:complete len:1789 (+) Transcript_14524:100-5466(+)